MKNILFLVFIMAFSGKLFAVEVEGKIFYPDAKTNNLIEMNATLDVPAKGKGSVILKGRGFKWTTNDFAALKDDSGREVFVAHFLLNQGGENFVYTMKGTYIRTNDRVLYYGDTYKQLGVLPPYSNKKERKHLGGFRFDYHR